MIRTIAAASRAISPLLQTFQNGLKINAPFSSKNNVLKYSFCGFKTSSVQHDLMEFFDDKKNWGEQQVKVGRSWKIDELRLKSNIDLHKLWYILLKERNMLMTMETQSNLNWKMFPNPERVDKVKESMSNLEEVVRERNRAYHLLETGETGERKVNLVNNEFGLKAFIKEQEHPMPRHMRRSKGIRPTFASKKFILLYKEKKYVERCKSKNRNKNHVVGLLRRFPNMDKDVLQKAYPDVNVDKVSRYRKSDGNIIKE